MKKVIILILVLFTSFEISGYAQTKKAPEKRTKVLIHTDLGDIKIVLYNETPKHRDNFIKLVKEGWYNGSIWHRVIKNFMIQGGRGGNGKEDPGYTIPAEILPAFKHKKGVLAAARTGDQVNPARASSGSQFYIVQGVASHLDGAYTIFGEVVEGLDVVDKIAAVQVDAQMNKPLKDIKMTMKIIQ